METSNIKLMSKEVQSKKLAAAQDRWQVREVNKKAALLETCCIALCPLWITAYFTICILHCMCNELPRFFGFVEGGANELSYDCNRLHDLVYFGKTSPASAKDGKEGAQVREYRLHMQNLAPWVPLRLLYDTVVTVAGKGSTYARSLWRRCVLR